VEKSLEVIGKMGGKGIVNTSSLQYSNQERNLHSKNGGTIKEKRRRGKGGGLRTVDLVLLDFLFDPRQKSYFEERNCRRVGICIKKKT